MRKTAFKQTLNILLCHIRYILKNITTLLQLITLMKLKRLLQLMKKYLQRRLQSNEKTKTYCKP